MFKEITKIETQHLLRRISAYAKNNLDDVNLGMLAQFYPIKLGYQLTYSGDYQDLIAHLAEESITLPENTQATLILEMTQGCTMSQYEAIFSWATACFGEKMERFEPVYPYDEPFLARITIIFHSPRRRSFCSSLNAQLRLQRYVDETIAGILDREFNRNDEIGALVEMDGDAVHQMITGDHLLSTEISNTTGAVSDIIERARPEIERCRLENDINGLLLFVEVDRAFTNMGKIDELKHGFQDIVGNIDILVNLRIRDSYIPYITCRSVLIGKKKYVRGDVYVDFGQYEILLYESENDECGHMIVATYANAEFTLSRFDWGDYERNRRGQTEDRHWISEEETQKLFAALHVKTPEALLRTIRRRFASHMPSSADTKLLAFCRNHQIEVSSDYYY